MFAKKTHFCTPGFIIIIRNYYTKLYIQCTDHHIMVHQQS